ncbi:MAG: LPXTG cell wall anchor domain-containing protein [Lachnospiraceae bacterium]|nr:LPXTG cell wall anchor domain-containing protein [Lachnospiraceae bacterium]
MKQKVMKRSLAILMSLALVCSFLSVMPVSHAEEVGSQYEELDLSVRTDLIDKEIVTADDINITLGDDFDPEDLRDGIHYDQYFVDVSFYPEGSDYEEGKAGSYVTCYLCKPKDDKDPYILKRVVNVSEPEPSEDDSEEGNLIGDERKTDELPLSEGEITTIQTSDASFAISLDKDNDFKNGRPLNPTDEKEEKSIASSILNFIFPTKTAKAADSMKVSYSGYISYCGHRIGYKYISSGEYKDCLAYCMDVGKKTTDGSVTSGGKLPAKITFCLVNGARKKGEKCHTSKYSSGDKDKDYFITSAAIHVLNGEVKLSYYDNGSDVYKNIKKMVEDAKHLDKNEYNLNYGTVRGITYTVAPKASKWKQIKDGLYRSEDKFVREKTGTIKSVKYKVTGAPSGLKVGEISKDSSDISSEEDLAKYDIAVAQTTFENASSNFYVYANQEAMDRILAEEATIKVQATVYGDEKGCRKWKPAVANQQNITFLEVIENVPDATASVKLKAANIPKGSLLIKKTDNFDPNKTLDGAVYALFEDEECEDMLCELTKTNTDGDPGYYASDIEELTQKKYYLKEIECPEGYQIDETVYEIDISYFTLMDAAGNVTQEGRPFEVNDIPEPSRVMLIKKDKDSGATVTNATFAIFDDEACTTRALVNPNNPSDGVVPEFGYDDDLDAYVSDGFYLAQETYYVKEVGVPTGYFDSGAVYRVSPDTGEMVMLDAENEAIKCEIKAKKVDKEKTLPQGDAKLVGAVYGLYAKGDIRHPDGSGYMKGTEVQANAGTNLITYDVDATNGALLATITTDDNGEFGFKELYYGNYTIKEITPSEGYLLDETDHDVSFTSKGNTSKTLEIEVTSQEQVMKQAFELIKIETDGKSGETKKVKGAEFTVKLKSEIMKSSWEQATVYDLMTTDDKGFARSIELPYGTYVVRETKTPDDLESVKDFEVVIDHDDRTPQVWRIMNDAPFQSYIRLIKKDIETGKEVLLADTTFKIRKIGEEDYLTQKLGDQYISEFKTDERGTVTTPLRLMYGDYEVTEIKAPDGYLIKDTPVPFKVTTTGAVKVDKDKDGDPVIDVTIENQPVKGKIKIIKTGEKLASIEYDTIIDRIFDFITGDQRSITFQYEKAPLAGAVFNLIADEDVYTPDHQVDEKKNRIIATYDNKPVKKGEVIATVTTDDKGEAVVDNLPLGKYHLEEIETPKGYVAPDSIESIDLKFKDDHTAVIELESKIENIRQKTQVKVKKTEAKVYGEVASGGAVSVEPTGNQSPTQAPTATATTTITPAATASATPIATGTSASATPTATATTGQTATIAPTASPIPTMKSATYQAADVDEKPSSIVITTIPNAVSGSGVLLNEETAGSPVEGATYGIYSTTEIKNYKGEVLIEANTLIEAEKTDANGEITFTADLPLGRFYLKEIEPAPGYLIDESEYEVDFSDPDPKAKLIEKEMKVEDVPIVMQVSKADITTSHDIPDATLQIIDKNDEVFAEWTTDGTPLTITAIPPGDYTLKEIAAPYGYYMATEAQFSVEQNNIIKKVTMMDERAKGILEILKTDRESGEELMGAEFEIRNEAGEVVETITSDADGIARSSELDIGEYNPDGTFLKAYTYTVTESKAPEGYIASEGTFNVTFEYDDNALEPIVSHLNISNKPSSPPLPQTGGNHTPWAILGVGLMGSAIGVTVYKRRKRIGGKKS